MARWKVYVNENGKLALNYRNSYTGEIWECGTMGDGITQKEIIAWIIDKGNSNPGDVVVFPDNSALQIAFKNKKYRA